MPAGGRRLLMRLVDIQLSFPAILIALMILAVLGKGVGNVMIALVIVQWAYYARTARGAALVERGKEYIEAARVPGLSRAHRVPPPAAQLPAAADRDRTMQVARAIALEATLSFLGLGVPSPSPRSAC
jgi:peptide/nickel transport system permease protein